MDRETRRERTRQHIVRQVELRTRIFNDGDSSAEIGHRRSPHYWHKTKPLACRCAKRRHGNPRLNDGLCGIGERDRIYGWRAADRELRVLVRRGWDDWESDEVSVLETEPHPRFYRNQQGALRRS